MHTTNQKQLLDLAIIDQTQIRTYSLGPTQLISDYKQRDKLQNHIQGVERKKHWKF